MALENKLGITNSAELAREEERISKRKAVELFESGALDKLAPGRFASLQAIHKALFEDIYDFAGELRTVNLAKGNFRFAPLMYLEAALGNIDKMPQSTFDEIIEKYVEMNIAHPFREGNGRSTRLWLDQMLKAGIGQVVDWSKVDKEDYLLAMERSPIKDVEIKVLLKAALTDNVNSREVFIKGIDHSYYYEVHIDFADKSTSKSISPKISKYQFDTLNCSMEELAVLERIAQNPTIKQQELVNATGKSIATVKRIMKSLQDKNYIRRENGKRYGKWEVLVK